jgi:hypothetical protein
MALNKCVVLRKSAWFCVGATLRFLMSFQQGVDKEGQQKRKTKPGDCVLINGSK